MILNKKAFVDSDKRKIDPILPYTPYGAFSYDTIKLLIANEPKILYNDEEINEVLVKLSLLDFAFVRHDINPKTVLYIELNTNGRKLKELGSIDNYLQFLNDEDAQNSRRKLHDKYIFWVILFGSIGTCTSAVYDIFQLFDF